MSAGVLHIEGELGGNFCYYFELLFTLAACAIRGIAMPNILFTTLQMWLLHSGNSNATFSMRIVDEALFAGSSTAEWIPYFPPAVACKTISICTSVLLCHDERNQARPLRSRGQKVLATDMVRCTHASERVATLPLAIVCVILLPGGPCSLILLECVFDEVSPQFIVDFGSQTLVWPCLFCVYLRLAT